MVGNQQLRTTLKKGVVFLTATAMSICIFAKSPESASADMYESTFVTEYGLAEDVAELKMLKSLDLDITSKDIPDWADPVKLRIVYTLKNSVVNITEEEYYETCAMTFCESGHCSWDMMNGCASAAVNQALQQGKTIKEVLNTPGRFRDGIYEFKDYQDKDKYIVRKVTIDDFTPQLYDAVNSALLGYDRNSELIGDTIGFWSPRDCPYETNQYFYAHVPETTPVENVHFFSEWMI